MLASSQAMDLHGTRRIVHTNVIFALVLSRWVSIKQRAHNYPHGEGDVLRI